MIRRTVVAAIGFFLTACGSADAPSLEGTWRLDPARSRYAGTAEARTQETFTCREGQRIECEIAGVKADGSRASATFSAAPGGRGTVQGVEGVDGVELDRRDDGWHAVFSDGDTPVLGYRITPYADSLIVETTDPRSGERLGTRIVYTRAP